MDVLAYSAFNQQVQLNQQIVAKNSCLSTKCSETAALQATAAGFSAAGVCWVQCIEPCLLRRPTSNTAYWCCIPDLTGATGGFKVCNTAAQFNCGFCCAWTVPSGITRARFQIWGAGSGSAGSMCCGGSPWGSTGAYASVIIPVTAGDTYTLCAGCAYCCFPARYFSGRVPGCPSWVQGTGLCNICANGGQGRMGSWMTTYGKGIAPWKISTVTCNYGGPCMCYCGNFYCFYSSCSTCGQIPFVAGATYHGTTTSASNPSIVYGIRGNWPSICFDTNHYGHQCHAPIYGFPASSCCTFSWSSGTCCGCFYAAANGYLQVPGAGGWPSIAMGGSYTTCGDMGRMGMVCVSYC